MDGVKVDRIDGLGRHRGVEPRADVPTITVEAWQGRFPVDTSRVNAPILA